jgi:hypothetical protein
MNKYLLFAILLFPAISFAQNRGDKKIIITVTDTSNLLNRISYALYENGYDIHTKDVAVSFISTEPKAISISWLLIGRFLIKGNTIVITGEVGVNSNADRRVFYEPMEYHGLSVSLNKGAWKELEEIGRLFGDVTFSK